MLHMLLVLVVIVLSLLDIVSIVIVVMCLCMFLLHKASIALQREWLRTDQLDRLSNWSDQTRVETTRQSKECKQTHRHQK